MAVIIYIWNPTEFNSEMSAILASDVGHVSMLIKDTYISHRACEDSPEKEKINKIEKLIQNSSDFDYTKKYTLIKSVKASQNILTYKKEVEQIRKRSADEIYKIIGLNEDEMLKFWQEGNLKLRYHPMNQNCSTIIAEIIFASCNSFTKSKLEKKLFNDFNFFQKKHDIVPGYLRNFTGSYPSFICSNTWMKLLSTPGKILCLIKNLPDVISSIKVEKVDVSKYDLQQDLRSKTMLSQLEWPQQKAVESLIKQVSRKIFCSFEDQIRYLSKFTEDFVKRARESFPEYNVAIIKKDIAHNKYGYYTAQEHEVYYDFNKSTTYIVYFSETGKQFFLGNFTEIGSDQWNASGYQKNQNSCYSNANMTNFKCKIKSVLTGKIINVAGNSRQSGANIIQYEDNYDTNSQWKFKQIEPGIYKITSVSSELELNVKGASHNNNVQIIQYIQSKDQNSKWRIIQDEGNGQCRIQSVESNKVLNVKGASKKNGVPIIHYDDNPDDKGNLWTFDFL